MSAEMANPFANRPGRRPTGGPSPQEFKKIFFLMGGLLLLLATMAVLFVKLNPGREGEKQIEPVVPQEPPESSTPTPDPESDPTPEAPAGQVSAEQLQQALLEIGASDPKAEIIKESTGFITLLSHFLRDLKPEDVTPRLESALTYEQLIGAPDAHRGKFVRFEGELAQVYTEEIKCTTPTGTRFVYLGVLVVRLPSGENRSVFFYLPELPTDPKTGHPIVFKTRVLKGVEVMTEYAEVEGMFLRLYTYEPQRMERPNAPLNTAVMLFAKNLRLKTPPPPETAQGEVFVIIAASAFLLMLCIVMIGIYSKRSSR